MSLDLDLCRRLLDAAAQAGDAGAGADAVPEAEPTRVAAQVALLIAAGLAKEDAGDEARLGGLTPAGREFLRLARNEALWSRVKRELAGPGRSPDLGAIRARLLEWAQFSF